MSSATTTTSDLALTRKLSPELRTISWQLGMLFLLIVALYAKVLAGLFNVWTHNDDYSHGIFVPLLVAFIAWHKRDVLRALPVTPSNVGFAGLLLALLMLGAGTIGAELYLARTSLVVLLGSVVVSMLGWKWLRELIFPWLLLVMMIPIPVIVFNEIAFPLQLLASRFATDLLSLAGVPVFREGNIINLPSIQLEVAQACSGIRSLMTLGTLSLMYAYIAERGLFKRTVLVAAALPIALITNALRIFGTGLCAQYWDPDKAEGFFHEFSGWVMFIIALLLLMATHALLRVATRWRRAE